VVPAAGRARRLGSIEGSKEVLRVRGEGRGPRPVGHDLLESLAAAGIETAVVVLRTGKWDLPPRLVEGAAAGLRLAFVVTPETASVAETVDVARPFLEGAEVLLGFPDCLLRPREAAARLRARRESHEAAVTLALFPSRRPDTTDRVEVDERGRVRALEVRPGAGSSPGWTWLLAAWGAEFAELLHERVARSRGGATASAGFGSLSPAFGEALAAGLEVDSVRLANGRFLDVGTPEDLESARREGLTHGPADGRGEEAW
jgi:glucose-1-phosphate thymidylyltransferase